MPILSLLTKLGQVPGVSGFEDPIRAVVAREMRRVADEVFVTQLGSVVAIKRAARRSKSRDRAARLLVEAHMDQVGLIVTGIEGGLVRFTQLGYLDPRVLPAQTVIVHGEERLPGVIGMRPPHVVARAESDKVIPLDELYIDVGLTASQVRELVKVGDPVTFDREVVALSNDRLAGCGLDNRAGVAVLLEWMHRMGRVDHSWDLYAVANVREEWSQVYVGALTSTYQLRPAIGITLDVTYAAQPQLSDSGYPELGGGPCIARGPNIHPTVFKKLLDAAEVRSIPHRVTVYGGDTETDAWMMQVVGDGVATGLIELPLRYMHNPVEVIAASDLENSAILLESFASLLSPKDLESLNGEKYSRPKLKKTPLGRRAVQVRAKPRRSSTRA